MKKLLYYLPVIALFLALSACEDKEEAPKASLKVAPSSIDMPKEGGTQIVAIITNQTNILARGYDETWCKVSIEGLKMTIDVQPNNTRWERTTDIVVVAGEEDNLVKTVITVVQEVETENYRIVVPTDFSSGLVQKVMDGDIQVAEICNEYIQLFSEQKRATVIYPMTSGGKADLTKGFVIDNGGTLQWDMTTRKYNYTAGTSSPLSKVYLTGSHFVVSPETSNEVTTTVVPYTISDGDQNTYRIVKIGLQYWTAENLRTTSYIDGTPITRGETPQAWATAQDGLYNWFSDNSVNIEASAELQKLYGAYYNWYAVGSGKLAPQGWRVPTDDPNGEFWGKGGDDFSYLMYYIENGQYWQTMGAKLKLAKTAAEGSQPDYSVGEWTWFSNDEAIKGNNISGFSAIPAGYYYAPSSTYFNFSNIAMFWSATSLTSNLNTAMMRSLQWDTSQIYFGKMEKTNGYSIRFVRE